MLELVVMAAGVVIIWYFGGKLYAEHKEKVLADLEETAEREKTEARRQAELDCNAAYTAAFGTREETLTRAVIFGRDTLPATLNKNVAQYELVNCMVTALHLMLEHFNITAPFRPLTKLSDIQLADLTRSAPLARQVWDGLVQAYYEELARQLPKVLPHPDGPQFLIAKQPVSLDEHAFIQAIQGRASSLTYTLNVSRQFHLSPDPATKKCTFDKTPLVELRSLEITYPISHDVRLEHTWIVGGTGAGKTTLLSNFISYDMMAVAEGKASLVVMESNRAIVPQMERLGAFGPGGKLEGKLVSIDLEDVEFPTAINLFDLAGGSSHLSARDERALRNATMQTLEYIFRALLGAELSSRMSTLFSYSINVLMEKPGATLDDMMDLLSKDGEKRFSSYIDKCDEDTQRFFAIRYNETGEMQRTKGHVVERLDAIKRMRELSAMFRAPKSKLNFYEEMEKGRVIIINTAGSLLGEEGVEIVSRFFLAMVLYAAQKRQLIDERDRLPTYFYIDEAQEVIWRDEKLPVMLDQARKYKVGLILAQQRFGKLQPNVLNALHGTSIKMAARIPDANAHALAREMATTADFINKQPAFHFAVHSKPYNSAASYSVMKFSFGEAPQMTEEQYQRMKADMRRRYSFDPYRDAAPPRAPAPSAPPKKKPDNYDPTIATPD